MTPSDVQRESWKRMLAEQQASGLSVSSWCRDHDIDKVKFYYWRRRLSVATAPRLSSVSEPGGPQWLAVGADSQQQPQRTQQTAPPGLTLRIGRIEVEISTGFDPHLLSDVLGLLEAR